MREEHNIVGIIYPIPMEQIFFTRAQRIMCYFCELHMALAAVALFYGMDPEGEFAVSVQNFREHSCACLPSQQIHTYAYASTCDRVRFRNTILSIFLQVPKMAMISVFSFLFMIPISTVVPWMFQVQ